MKTQTEAEKRYIANYYAGSFMTAVFTGDFLDAYAHADLENRAALKSILE